MPATAVRTGPVLVNPIVYAEVSVGFDRIEDLDDALPSDIFRREPVPYVAAFLAGKAYRTYRSRGAPGSRHCPTFSSARTRPSPARAC